MSPVAPPPPPRRGPTSPVPPPALNAARGLVANHIDKQQDHHSALVQPPREEYREDRQQQERQHHQTRIEIYQRDVKVRRQLLRPDGTPMPRRGGGQRGTITGLSRNAARRLRFTLDNIRGLAYVLHLTYPAQFPRDGTVVKGHWKLMREWIVRQGHGGVWTLEFQAGGGPHFMVLLDGRLEKDAVAARWAAIVNSAHPEHLRCSTRIERVRNQHAIRNYMVKQLDDRQKLVPEHYRNVGRLWSCFGSVKAEPVRVLEGSREELARVVRSLRKLEYAVRRKRLHARQGDGRGKAVPRRDNGVSGWTAQGLAPVAGRCLERLAPDLLERALTPSARSRRSGRRAVANPSLIPCLVRHRLADWELLEDWLWAEWRRLQPVATAFPTRPPRRDRADGLRRRPGLVMDRVCWLVNRLTDATHTCVDADGRPPRAGWPPWRGRAPTVREIRKKQRSIPCISSGRLFPRPPPRLPVALPTGNGGEKGPR